MARKIICEECGCEYSVERDRRGDTEGVGLCDKCHASLKLELRPRPFPVRRRWGAFSDVRSSRDLRDEWSAG